MTTTTDQHEAKAREDRLVLVDDRGDYAVVTINRPEKRNAMNSAVQRRFRRP